MAVGLVPHNKKENWFIILVLIIAVMLVVALSSCVTEKQRKRILKEYCVTSSSKKDSTFLKIKERLVPYIVHDSIPYFLPNPCDELCDSIGRLKTTFKTEITSDKGTKVKLTVKDNKLVINDNVTGLKGTVATKDTLQKEFHKEIKEVRANCMLAHLTKWDSFWIRMGQIFAFFLLIIIILFILKKVKKKILF
jgi:hypothetical protein